jgi:hypothetical protein
MFRFDVLNFKIDPQKNSARKIFKKQFITLNKNFEILDIVFKKILLLIQNKYIKKYNIDEFEEN